MTQPISCIVSTILLRSCDHCGICECEDNATRIIDGTPYSWHHAEKEESIPPPSSSTYISPDPLSRLDLCPSCLHSYTLRRIKEGGA